MRLLLAFSLLITLAAATIPAGQTFCSFYASALGATEVELMNFTIHSAVGGLVGDQVTLPWFDGRNNFVGKNFTDPAYATDLNTLIDHLIGFFGLALGCGDAAFLAGGEFAPGTFDSNMTAVHSGFEKPITGAAFDHFNEIVVQFLRGVGVQADDNFIVSGVLAGFRNLATNGGSNAAVICQASDCSSSYEVASDDQGFYPTVINVVAGSSVTVRYTGAGAAPTINNAASVGNAQNCTAGSAVSGNTLGPLNNVGDVYFISNHCNATAGATQTGYLKVTVFASPATSPPSTSPSSSNPSTPSPSVSNTPGGNTNNPSPKPTTPATPATTPRKTKSSASSLFASALLIVVLLFLVL